MSGNSSRHGGHVVCMKLTQTALPLSVDRSIVPPPTWATTRAGAACPTWKLVVAPAPDREPLGTAGLADVDGPATADGLADAAPDGDGDGDAARADGGALAGGVGAAAGTARMTPARTASATRTPATRPARTDSRGPMRRRVP